MHFRSEGPRHGGHGHRHGARRRLAPEQRKQELLDAAVRVLRRHHQHEGPLEDITNAARTAKGNFYRYFTSWQDMLDAIRTHVMTEYRTQVVDRLAARLEVDWWAVLDDETHRYLDFQLTMGPLHEIVFHGPG